MPLCVNSMVSISGVNGFYALCSVIKQDTSPPGIHFWDFCCRASLQVLLWLSGIPSQLFSMLPVIWLRIYPLLNKWSLSVYACVCDWVGGCSAHECACTHVFRCMWRPNTGGLSPPEKPPVSAEITDAHQPLRLLHGCWDQFHLPSLCMRSLYSFLLSPHSSSNYQGPQSSTALVSHAWFNELFLFSIWTDLIEHSPRQWR